MAESKAIRDLILTEIPADGTSIGNKALLDRLNATDGYSISEEDYRNVRNGLIAEGMLAVGKGRGGSVMFTGMGKGKQDTGFLKPQIVPQRLPTKPKKEAKKTATRRKKAGEASQVISYRHEDKRKNNPHVGMVDTTSDGIESRTTWAYDPHLDPVLQFDIGRGQIENLIDDALASGDQAVMREALEQLKRLQEPYLNWSGKAERTSFEVDTVSLHVHERIDPATILAAIQKRLKSGKDKGASPKFQLGLFSAPFENLPLREAIDFYKHERDWANRLIAGDSLLVMNSLLQKESMAGQVQMIYIDPPYGIKYGSNFQPFVNKREVKDRKDDDLTQEPEMIKAFRDTWELGVHSYLTYLRDRLLMAKELLRESGSVFVQISDENLHHVRELLEELFGAENFCGQVSYRTTGGQSSAILSGSVDYILWYAKDKNKAREKYHVITKDKAIGEDGSGQYVLVEPKNKVCEPRKMTSDELREIESVSKNFKILAHDTLYSQGSPSDVDDEFFVWRGTQYRCPSNTHWKPGSKGKGMTRLERANRLMLVGNTLRYKRYYEDYPVAQFDNVWNDTAISGFGRKKEYVVETNEKVIERCLLMTTDPGDLVLDPTCGSGTTAFVAEKWGRRWITTDTSRVAVTLAKQRLTTASYDYYDLKYPNEGLKGGFVYKTVPHVMLKFISNNQEIDEIYERMHPAIERNFEALNDALKGQQVKCRIIEGGRKGEALDFSKNSVLNECEVPYDFPVDWPDSVRKPFDTFHKSRQAMQQKMDESIAAHSDREILYDQPQISKNKLRITGPFTVEAVPFPSVLGLDEAEQPADADVAVARSGETSRQGQWRDELIKAGIRGKGGQILKLAELETLPGSRYIHAVGTVAESGERVAVSFGPEHAALEQRQVEIAMREAGELFPLPKMLVFCAFTFDPEAAKDIDNIKGITALKVQMNTDLLTEDLKKGKANNESFWLMGQPDIDVRQTKEGFYQVEVNGFDYFDTKNGELKSGGKKQIAMWSLDTDYDDRSLLPRQVFFPMAGGKEGWHKLKKDIKAELNEDMLEQFHGTVSLPFEAGDNRRIAVKIVDDRGIESLKVIDLD